MRKILKQKFSPAGLPAPAGHRKKSKPQPATCRNPWETGTWTRRYSHRYTFRYHVWIQSHEELYPLFGNLSWVGLNSHRITFYTFRLRPNLQSHQSPCWPFMSGSGVVKSFNHWIAPFLCRGPEADLKCTEQMCWLIGKCDAEQTLMLTKRSEPKASEGRTSERSGISKYWSTCSA